MTTHNPIPALQRAYARAYKAMTVGDGYQPYGYDWPTIRLTKPAHAAKLSSLLAAIRAESCALQAAGLHPSQAP